MPGICTRHLQTKDWQGEQESKKKYSCESIWGTIGYNKLNTNSEKQISSTDDESYL